MQNTEFHITFKAVCFRKMSFDLNMTAAIQIVTKKPVNLCRKPNVINLKRTVVQFAKAALLYNSEKKFHFKLAAGVTQEYT